MIYKRLIKIAVLSLSLSVVSIGAAFASADMPSDAILFASDAATDDELYSKQAEIDKILFEEYSEELKEKEIFITHTGVADDYIEVGITPYTPENAEYVSGLVGNDGIKVVEGTQAVTLQYSPESNESGVDPAELADDSQIVTVDGDFGEDNGAANSPPESEQVSDAKLISAPINQEKGISPVVIAARAAFAVVFGAVLFRKKTA